MRLPLVILSALVVVACEKSSTPAGGIQPSQESPSAPTSPASAPAATSVASAPTPAPSPAASGETMPPATAGADAGKGRDGGATAMKPVSKHVGGNNFALDLASPGCKAATECTMTIKLVASSDYHVNKEYPYKFTAVPAPGLEFLGKGDATFTRASGDFVEQGEKTGLMTVRFKPASPGEASVKGTYKFSVCSADQCQIEQEKLELTIPVL